MNKYTKKLIAISSFTLIILLLLSALPVSADVWDGSTVDNRFSGGNGSQDNPYIVSTAAELAYLGTESALTESRGKYYKLTADIYLADKPWIGIGTSGTAFSGIFDGDNHTISGLNIDSEVIADYGGVFGKTDGATIMNLNVTGSKIVAQYAGPVVAYGLATSVINCRTAVDWIEGSTIGGVVGRVQSSPCKIIYCTSESTLKQTVPDKVEHYIGGIAGVAGGASVSYCANLGNIVCEHENAEQSTKNLWVGGIVGGLGASSQTSSVAYCYNTGDISGYKSITEGAACYAGGIAGRINVADSSIIGCYTTGKVTWTTEKGGTEPATGSYGSVIGQIYKLPVVSNVYSTDDVFVGKDNGYIMPDSVVMLTPEQMQGKDALNNMSLGTSLQAVLDDSVAAGLDFANYKLSVMEAFESYSEGKGLAQYVKEAVLAKLSLPSDAELWKTAEGKTPVFGSYETVVLSSEIAGKSEALIVSVLEELYERYKSDPQYTTTSENSDTDEPTDNTSGSTTASTTASTPVTKIVDASTTASDGESAKKCSGFSGGTAAFAVLITGVLSCVAVIKIKGRS